MAFPISIASNHKWITEINLNDNLHGSIISLAEHQCEYTPIEKCKIIGDIGKKMEKMPIYEDADSATPSIQYRMLHLNNHKRTKYLVHVMDTSENINHIFCTVCVLFAKGKTAMRTKGAQILSYTVTNKHITSHEQSKAHLDAFKLYTEYNELMLGFELQNPDQNCEHEIGNSNEKGLPLPHNYICSDNKIHRITKSNDNNISIPVNPIISSMAATMTTTTTTTVTTCTQATTTYPIKCTTAISAEVSPSLTPAPPLTIGNLLSSEIGVKNNAVTRYRKIVSDVLRCVLFLVSIGLPLRKSSFEKSKNFDLREETIHLQSHDEGYFKSILKFTAFCNRDQTTFDYLKEMQNKFQINPGSKSRTFVSKHFLAKLLETAKSYSLKAISGTINSECNGKFSLQIDTATDKTCSQQCCVVARYVDKDLTIHSKIIAFLSVQDTKGVSLYKFVEKILSEIGLNIKNVVGSCTDGASNMFAANNGFLGLLEKANPCHISIWCVCHRLNLVIEKALSSCGEIKDLLTSIGAYNAFLRASPKRINIWTSTLKKLAKKYRDISIKTRPAQSNATRWWTKRKLFKNICKSVSSYLNFFISLININALIAKKALNCSPDQRVIFKQIYDEWSQDMKNIIIVHAVHSILDRMHDTLDYLQSSALPISEVVPSITSCYEYLENIYTNKNDSLSMLVKESCAFAHATLTELVSEDIQYMIGKEFQLPVNLNEVQKSEIALLIENFIKELKSGIEIRFLEDFVERKELFESLNVLCPSELCKIHENDEELSLAYLCRINNLNAKKTLYEFKKFSDAFKEVVQRERLQNVVESEIRHTEGYDEEQQEEMDITEEENEVNNIDMRAEWLMLKEFFSDMDNVEKYKNIHLLYQFAFTLPCAQVDCERSFSVMGHIKSSRRTLTSDDLLETYMIINSCVSDEDPILSTNAFPEMIDMLGKSSNYLSKRLIYAD